VSLGSPYVSVPVLSKIAVRHVSICSSTAGSLIMMPLRADSETDPMIVTGMAISSGHGVATTMTARNLIGSPLISQARTATAMATGV
jgi:hypothetical protein